MSIHLLIRLCQGYKVPKQIELFVWSSAPVNPYEKQRSRKIKYVFYTQKAKRIPSPFPRKASVLKICPRIAIYLSLLKFTMARYHKRWALSFRSYTTICSYKLRKRQSHSHKHRSQVVGSQILCTFKCFPALYSYKAYSFFNSLIK